MNPPVEAPTSSAQAAGDLEAERVERVLELRPTARDVAARLVDCQLDVLGDHLAGFGGAGTPAEAA